MSANGIEPPASYLATAARASLEGCCRGWPFRSWGSNGAKSMVELVKRAWVKVKVAVLG